MKVVINNCYGGFSLSKAAVLWLAERGHEGAKKEAAEMAEKVKKWSGQPEPAGIDMFEHRMAHEWESSPKEKPSLFGYSWHARDDEKDGLPRHHPLLVACVEALGGEHRQGASGPCAALKIVEIPDGVEYQIEEYDGQEWVAEKHRTWA